MPVKASIKYLLKKLITGAGKTGLESDEVIMAFLGKQGIQAEGSPP